jgi:hypothetical protein
MNKPGRPASLAFYGIGFALLAATAFLYFEAYFVLIFVPIVVYTMWSMHNRIKALEKRLAGPEGPQTKNA